jgi:hypothetical protein
MLLLFTPPRNLHCQSSFLPHCWSNLFLFLCRMLLLNAFRASFILVTNKSSLMPKMCARQITLNFSLFRTTKEKNCQPKMTKDISNSYWQCVNRYPGSIPIQARCYINRISNIDTVQQVFEGNRPENNPFG